MVGQHDRQGQRRQDGHAGGRAHATQEGQQRQAFLARGHRQGQHVQIRRHLAADIQLPGPGDGQHRQGDQQQVQREQPARHAQVAFLAQFHDADVELVRQGEHGNRTQTHQRIETAVVIARRQGLRTLREIGETIVRAPHHERTHGQQCGELEQRFEAQCQHDAAVVFRGRSTARAEQHGEGRHHQRHPQRSVEISGLLVGVAANQQGETQRHRLQLQGDVRHHAQQRNGGDGDAQAPVLAEARGHQVGQ